MKNSTALSCAAALLVAVPVLQAQGMVIFANRLFVPYVDSPIFYPDGVTPARAGTVYAGLWAGPDADSLAPVGAPVLLGPYDGYFETQLVSIPTMAPGEEAWFRVRVWDVRAEGFDDAKARGLLWGESNLVRGVLGGFPDPEGPPVPSPTGLVGLGPITLVPEPSSGVLLVLGGGLWLWVAGWRSKRS